MAERDQVEVFLRNGKSLTYGVSCPDNAVSHDIVRIEVSREGGDRKVVFYTDPKDEDTLVECRSGGKVRVNARLAWLLGTARIYLAVLLDRQSGKFEKLELQSPNSPETLDLLPAWRNGEIEQRDRLILDTQTRFAGDLVEKIGVTFEQPDEKKVRGLRAYLRPLQDKECRDSSEKRWAPVLEAVVKLNEDDDRLGAFGVRARIDAKPTVRVLQIPKPLVCGEEEAAQNPRNWFVAFLGLPHAWGRTIWNDLLGEQVRASELDLQHGSLFAPLFPVDNGPNANLSWNLVLAVQEKDPGKDSVEISDQALRLSSKAQEDLVKVRFPLLKNHLDSAIEATLPLSHTFLAPSALGSLEDFKARLELVLDAARRPGIALSLREDKTLSLPSDLPADPRNRSIRMGAMDITFAVSPLKGEPNPELRWNLVTEDRQNPLVEASSRRFRWQEASVQLSWPVESVTPGGQDDLPGEFFADCDPERLAALEESERLEREIECKLLRERPLVVPLGTPKPQTLILKVTERSRVRDLRRIDLRLRIPEDKQPPPSPPIKDNLVDVCVEDDKKSLDRVVVLDHEPFLAAKVSYPALGSLKNAAEDTEVANWSSYGADAGTWHIRFPDAQNFCLTLPPQGVGETMEKKKTLADSELADFRLSPPALLSMRERYYRQNFPEAPWNLRRLLSDPSRELPGAQVDSLQYELLYGLSCRVDYPFMRLAEISALVGEVNGPLPPRPSWAPHKVSGNPDEKDPNALSLYNKARNDWAEVSQRTRRRLGIFELWDIRRLDTLELKEGVTCWIRQNPTGTKAPDTLVPVPIADLADPIEPAGDKLKGGATWGFESRNVYHAVVRNGPHETWPESSGAEIKDTHLSALGGYGHQMAAFDNWRSKILADVAMGRTYSYTLERIGRIGVWWNRAKHVIIYQRTVVPSEQFAGDQNELAGRAVLRKVEEYVEILQNVRKYPDTGPGDPRATGFVNECCFSDDPNQVVRFRVKSDWGADIGNIGWKVQIWRPGELPADLYPKPIVNLTVMASVDGESVPRKVTIADPENLFFYTDTTVPPEALENPKIDLSNTDAWLPVEGVDFVDEARPRPASDKAFESGSLQQVSAGDTALPVGFRPCTFLIEPAEHTVDLLANRRGDPMGAALSSVTLCRAKLGQAQASLTGVVENARSVMAEEIRKHLESLPAEASRLDVNQIKKDFEDVCSRIGGAVDQAVREPAARLQEGENRLKELGSSIKDLVKKLDEQATEKIAAEAERLTLYPESLVRKWNGTKDDLKKQLGEEIERARSQVALMPSPAAYLSSVESALHEMEQQLTSSRDRLNEILATSVDLWLAADRLPELIDRLRTYRSQLRAISQRLRGLADSGASLGNGDRNLALGIEPRFVAKSLDLQKIANAVNEAEAAFSSIERLAAGAEEYKDLAKSRLAQLAQQKTPWDEGIENLGKLLKSIGAHLQQAKRDLQDRFMDFTQKILAAAESKIDSPATDAMVDRLRKAWKDAVTQQAEVLKTELNKNMDNVRDATEEFFSSIKLSELIPTPENVRTAVESQCTELKSRLESMLKEIGGNLGNALGIDRKVAEIRSFLERQRDEALRQIEEELGGGVKVARQILGAVESKGDDVLKLVRAFGKPPEVSGLKFDRPEVAFFYDELKDHVDVTPVIARAAQAAAIVEALKPFGVDLPVKQLGEQLIPAELKNFDLSSILPNIAGIPLKNLFSGLKMPKGVSDAVKVRHGVDPHTRRAWLHTDVDFEIASNATLFAVGPLAIRVNQPHFKAEARLEADLKGIQQRRVSGRLAGDWQLQIGGSPLITFQKTPLEFDEAGRVNFQVEPSNVQLAPALSFINDLMSRISPGGLTTRFDGDGVVSTLDLPIPDTQLGAFGFSGLSLGASLALRYSGGDFNLGVTASLARRDAPFTLTIFILGGAGYLELGAQYSPKTGKVTATADLAIAASASLAIALGPIRGGVAVYVGVTANYNSANGGGLVVGLMFMIRGHVSVLSIVSVTITLRLDGQYQGGALVGRGYLEIKIKICWCFTLKVSASVTYTLGRVGSANKRAWLGGPQPVARIASLGGLSADFAETGGPAPARPLELDRKALKNGVKAYLDMLV